MKSYDRMTTEELAYTLRVQDRIIASLVREVHRLESCQRSELAEVSRVKMSAARMRISPERRREIARMGGLARKKKYHPQETADVSQVTAFGAE